MSCESFHCLIRPRQPNQHRYVSRRKVFRSVWRDLQSLRDQRDNTNGAAKVRYECNNGDDKQNGVFFRRTPIQWVVRVARRLWDQDRLAVFGGLQILTFTAQTIDIEDVSTMVPEFVNRCLVMATDSFLYIANMILRRLVDTADCAVRIGWGSHDGVSINWKCNNT